MRSQPTNIESRTFRALTGLENERGERVEQGEILPRDFVPEFQIEIWLANHDIVVAFEGTPVDDALHFLRLLSDAKIGSTVTLSVLRDGRRTTVKAAVVQAQDQRPRRR